MTSILLRTKNLFAALLLLNTLSEGAVQWKHWFHPKDANKPAEQRVNINDKLAAYVTVVILKGGGVDGSDRWGVHLTGPQHEADGLDVIAFLSIKGLRLTTKTDEWEVMTYYPKLTLATPYKLVELIGGRRGKGGLIPAGVFDKDANNCSTYAGRFFCHCCTKEVFIGDEYCSLERYCENNVGLEIPSHVKKNYSEEN